jgi:hypothetical protein
VNISGRNSSVFPNTAWWISELYRISGMLTVMYTKLNLSKRKILDLLLAGASLSNARRNKTSQKIVYTILIGNSAAVKRSGKRETWPATARGLNAPR